MAKKFTKKKKKPSMVLPVTVTRVELQVFIHDGKAWVNADDLHRSMAGILVMDGNPYAAVQKVLDAITDARTRFQKEEG